MTSTREEKLSSRERILTAVRHQEPDTVPITPGMGKGFVSKLYHCSINEITWRHMYETGLRFGYDPYVPWGWHDEMKLKSRKLNPKVSREDQGNTYLECRMYETPKGPLREKISVPKDKFFAERNPDEITRTKEFLVKDEKDLEKLPYIFSDPEGVDVKEYRIMKKIVKDNALIMVYAPEVLKNAVMLHGLENLMMGMYDNREFVMEFLHFLQGYVLRRTEVLLDKLHPDVVYTTGAWTTESLWSPQTFNEIFAPLVAEQTKLIRDAGSIHHYFVDGKMMGHLDKVREIGVGIFSTLEPPPTGDGDLKIAKKKIGDKVTLWGNVDPIWVLERGTKHDIVKAVRKAVEDGGKGGGFVLSLGEFITYRTPEENLRAFVKAGREFGKYS